MKIAVIGSVNMDIVMKVHRLPQKGETLLAENYLTVPGGKGANQAVAAARLGAEVSMIGALGKDPFGDSLLEELRENDIETSGIQRVPGPSGNALITVDDQGDNTILVYPGANGKVTPEWVEAQAEQIRDADWIMLQLEIPMDSVVKAAQLARKWNKKVLLNPAPAAALPDELIALVDVLTPNETELQLLSGEKEILPGIENLLQKGVKTVVVTLGAEGSMANDGEMLMRATPYTVKAVDATAAGDAFNAGLVVALGEGKPMEEALSFANAAGALTATKLGAQSALPDRKTVDQFRRK